MDPFMATRFVLVEPRHPGNVGAAARALKTMGFARLVLVAPRVEQALSDPQAVAMASGADDVLAAAQIVPTLADALVGAQWSVAVTARTREYGPPRCTAHQAALHVGEHIAPGEVALVFGNERTGLRNEDVERCNAQAHIPANPAYSSLNLAQAVQVLAYELRNVYMNDAAGIPSAKLGQPMAANEDIEQMFAHLERALIAIDFLDPAHPKKLMPRLRQLFARSGLTQEEVNILRGVARQVLLTRKKVDEGSH